MFNSNFTMGDLAATSRRVAQKASITWKVIKYSKSDLKTGEAFISPDFCFSGGNEKFYMKLYPEGFSETSKNDISVHLYSVYGIKITVNWTISIVNIEDINKNISKSQNNVLGNKYLLGSLFISRKKLESEIFYSLPNDDLLILCSVCETGMDVDNEETFQTVERHSISVMKKGSLTWNIIDFSKKNGGTLISPEFGISGMKEKFSLRLDPKGIIEENRQYISVFLSCDADKEVSLSMTISIVNIADRKKDISKSITMKRKFQTCYGIEKFISRDKLFGTYCHLLVDDELTLSCVINLTEHIVDKEYTITNDITNDDNTQADDSYRVYSDGGVNSDENNDSWMQAWGILIDNKDFADVVLKAGDLKLSPSKFLLKAGAAIFSSALRDLKNETDAEESDLKEENIIEEFLISLYPDVCRHFDSVDFRLKLLLAAHRNNMSGLRKECVKYLTDNLSEANVFRILVEAQCLGDQELYAKCLGYISQELISKNFLYTWKQKLFPIPKTIELTAECLDRKNNVRKYTLLSVSRSSYVIWLVAFVIWGVIYFSI